MCPPPTPSSTPPIDRLFDEATSPTALRTSWAHVRARNAGPGIDKVTVNAFERHADDHLSTLHRELTSGTWQPRPALRYRSAREPTRPIAIATVRDRIVQRAMAVVLTRAWDARIADHVYAYRPGRSVRQALAAVRDGLAAGYTTWARTDIRRFFDRIDRSLLESTLLRNGIDPRFVTLVNRLVAAGAISSGGAVEDDGTGIPQGSALSPVLSNLYLAPFDAAVEDLGAVVIRYADDLLVLADTPSGAREIMAGIQEAAGQRKLSLNARKTRYGDARMGFRFLGMRFDPSGHVYPDLPGDGLLERLKATALDEPAAARTLLDEWASWYGPFPAENASHPHAILALVRHTCSASPDPEGQPSVDTLGRLARRHLTLSVNDGRADAEQGSPGTSDTPNEDEQRLREALFAAWSDALDRIAELGGNDSNAASDVRRALVGSATTLLSGADPPVATVARLLGLDPEAVAAAATAEQGVAAALASELLGAGQGRLAAAARSLAQQPPTVERPPPESGFVQSLDDDTLLAVAEKWLDRELWEETRDARGHHAFTDCAGSAARRLRKHLAGERRLGVALTPRPGQARLLAMSLGPRRRATPGTVELHEDPRVLLEEARRQNLDAVERARKWMQRACRVAEELGVDPVVEETTCGRVRLWVVLAEPVASTRGARLLRRIGARTGPVDADLALLSQPPPEQGRRSMGIVLPLPLGRCPRRGTWSRLLDASGEPLVAGMNRLASVERFVLAGVNVSGEREARVPAGVRKDSVADPVVASDWLAGWPRAAAIMGGCGALASMVGKAERLGVLEADERSTLHEVLGHLPEPEGQAALEAVLGPLGITPGRIRRRVSTLPPLPLGCRKVHARHPRHVGDAGCAGCVSGTVVRPGCAGDGDRGSAGAASPRYPSPLMHAVGVRGWMPVTRNGQWHTAATQRHDAQERARKEALKGAVATGDPGAGVAEDAGRVQDVRGGEDTHRVGRAGGGNGEVDRRARAGADGAGETEQAEVREDSVPDGGVLLIDLAPAEGDGRGGAGGASDGHRGTDVSEQEARAPSSGTSMVPGSSSGAADDGGGVAPYRTSSTLGTGGSSSAAVDPVRGGGGDLEEDARVLERSPGTGADEPESVEALMTKMVRIRRHIEDAERGLLRVEEELAAEFERRGVRKVRVALGWLVYNPDGRPRFVIELG